MPGTEAPEVGRGEAVAFWLMFLYFAAKVCFFALRIRERVFPDEASWFGIVQVFSRSWLPPLDSPESYPFGLITHTPTLYFFLMGKALACNIFPISDLLFVRLLNAGLSLLTVAYGWRLAEALRLSSAVRCLFMVMLTNTVMFTFVSAAVSYDTMSTLFAVLALYYLIIFFQGRRIAPALLSGCYALAGTLTKIVLLPYCLALLLVVTGHERKRALDLLRALPSMAASLRGREAGLAVLCLCLFAANLQLYGGNLIRFGSVLPTMDKVLPIEACLQNRLFARDYAVREFQAGRLTLLDAQRIALQIRDPGDRASAWGRLAEAAGEKQRGAAPRMGRWRYAIEWVEVVVSRSYSVAAHLSLFKYDRDFYPYYALFVLAGILWGVRRRDLLTPGMGGIMVVAIFYVLFLMQVVSYTTYRGSGASGLALTGRYLFPVLVPVYLLTAQGLLAKTPRWWQALAGGGVAIFFVLAEFPWFVRNAGPEWYF